MPRSRSIQLLSLLVTGIVAAMGAVGCTKEAARSPTLEAAASPGAGVRASDSAPPALDTGGPLRAPDTPPAPAPRKPVGHPVPKPRPAPTPAPANSPSSPAAAPGPEAASDKWLSYDPATNTVTFQLIGGPRGFQFNGYTNGVATLTLPAKAKVVMNFVNKDGTPHSAAVISGEGPLPNADGDPAIPRAYTNQLLQGLPQEAGDVMRFQVPESGTYRIFCGVPGHGLSGMWLWLKVDPAAKAPSFGPTRG